MASSRPTPPVSPEFQEVFVAHADDRLRMTFAKFMELALYHPQVGYYRRDRPRVGTKPGTDFFTATSTGDVFGELVATACTELLRKAGRTPEDHRFVELGVEIGSAGILAGVSHPFPEVKSVGIGDSLSLTGDCVVFSNELFDAQPCVRSIFRHGRWIETGVELQGEKLVEVLLETPPPECPEGGTENYRFDQPLAAKALARDIAAAPWRGLFVAFDYGKTLRELIQETPGGTARGYFRHTQTNDLLANPGDQDLTCHICWDWIHDELRGQGFSEPILDFQETFFIRNAGKAIATISTAEATRMSSRKLALMQLLHPAQMGQKFQVTYARR